MSKFFVTTFYSFSVFCSIRFEWWCLDVCKLSKHCICADSLEAYFSIKFRVRGLGRWLECLHPKHGNQSSEPQNWNKCSVRVVIPCNPSLRGRAKDPGAGRTLKLRNPASVNKIEECLWTIAGISLYMKVLAPALYTQSMYMCTYTHSTHLRKRQKENNKILSVTAQCQHLPSVWFL